jgi:single-stranded-DNA-specific exonuclease
LRVLISFGVSNGKGEKAKLFLTIECHIDMIKKVKSRNRRHPFTLKCKPGDMSEITLPTTKWLVYDGDEGIGKLLARELGINPIVSQILTSRNIQTTDDAKKYLSPSLKDLHNPFLMRDVQEGVHRLIKAIYSREKIAVYGDYDADGVTSVVVLLKFLREIDSPAAYFIPNRITEGYGLHKNIIDKIKASGVTLIIAVDCGISDHDQVSYAKSIGIDVIILDHHEISGSVPDAVAAIDPHRSDCQFPFKHLAAVGVVYNFLIALRGNLRQEGFWANRRYPNLKEYLDLVALGTIGDTSPLVDENRIFAKIGLELISEGSRVGVRALKEVCGLDSQSVDAGKTSFTLLPRINAAGRIASPDDAVQLLLTDNMDEARELARKLDEYNRRRQAEEKNIFQDIVEEIEKKYDPEKTGSLVFASPKWHPGVVGIVASRLVERFSRPVILISLKDGIGKGSGRSIADFNIYQGIKKCESLLLAYGGHKFAAGISIREENIEKFAELMDKVVREGSDTSTFVSSTFIDAQCKLRDINCDLLSQMGMLAPFGSRNLEPVMCVRNVSITSPVVVGNNHLRIKVSEDGVSYDSIWFSKGQFLHSVTGTLLDIAFTPQFNDWKRSGDIQLKMKDIAIPVN